MQVKNVNKILQFVNGLQSFLINLNRHRYGHQLVLLSCFGNFGPSTKVIACLLYLLSAPLYLWILWRYTNAVIIIIIIIIYNNNNGLLYIAAQCLIAHKTFKH